MKKELCLMVVTSSLVSGLAMGDLYYDPVGDIATGNPNLDLTQVEITDNGVDIYITVTVAALDADWGKYLFFADFMAGGSGDNDNPWGRDIAGLAGMDAFIGTWLDGGGGAQWWTHDGAGWNDTGGISLAVDWSGSNSFTWSVSGAVTMMMANGASGFDWEVATTGGGADPAIDLFGGEGVQPGWGLGSVSTDLLHYEFAVPAPSALALLMLAGLNRRRRS